MKIYSPQIIGTLDVTGSASVTGSISILGSPTVTDGSQNRGYTTTAITTGGSNAGQVFTIQGGSSTGAGVTLDADGTSTTTISVIQGTGAIVKANTQVTGSLNVSSNVSASAYFGDGSNLTGISTSPFPFTGSANILGRVNVTISGSSDAYLVTSGSFTGSAIDNVSIITGSTQVNHVVYCTPTQYSSVVPDANTLYFISQSNVTTYTVANGQTASLDCSLSSHFVVNTNFTSSAATARITATNFTSGTVIYIRVNETSYPANTNVRPDMSVFTTGSTDVQWDNSVLMATSFDGAKLNVISYNLIG